MQGNRAPRQFVLCFDGTGNKFSGNESDSNVLKIFRMLDRSSGDQFHYYQPGIGTYVTSTSLSSSGRIHKIRSAYLKAKDAAIGSTLAEHVMGGYKFLMRYYTPGDDIFFFGFSRGAYVARFLAEMLDEIGLLEAGNEELLRFAWKTFAKWQQRRGNREQKEQLSKYMEAFRETFSRPVSQIRFLGLFDTVNSVPRFENAWMQRSKFPYTARTRAKVIRHAVSIDERRAKFRQDLIGEVRPSTPTGPTSRRQRVRDHLARHHLYLPHDPTQRRHDEEGEQHNGATATSGSQNSEKAANRGPQAQTKTHTVYRPPARRLRDDRSARSLPSAAASCLSLSMEAEEDEEQDIEEVWFPGCHADIGGGWELKDGETYALSHAPLVWMVEKAQEAGVQFSVKKRKDFNCWHDPGCKAQSREQDRASAENHKSKPDPVVIPPDNSDEKAGLSHFEHVLRRSSTDGKIHDCLEFRKGLPWTSVLSWKAMEYMPFRRMDLQEDGSWKPIRWPLPRGEVRDIPHDAKIHVSAINRLKVNPEYRPGNLIIGGGGRGVKIAPKDRGIGEWEVAEHHGCPIQETYLRKQISHVAVA
ncbi:hypothetical protein BDV37DRAFT_282946 [Aspergillus pseudonomiae]|uniref:T6SS Phospholipase effector Tle1-like catalytic domain-containing protein n=1 Tax=Aspergillus pseudonomiae TaxID=1506151 RepID=A0A5N7DDF2_9EURO|nr:uncharacterized protein BDV37DRAFT_282946 [Aspergillus pseudonomiae]KAE8404397.1 hypothetical protein BDV37DRAFT_282946 [Aspergillus pseudonomiae]